MLKPQQILNRLSALLQKRSTWPWLGAGLLFLIGTALGSESAASRDSTAYLLGRTLLALTVILGVLYLSVQGLKRWKGIFSRASTHQMTIQETLSLGPRRALHLVRIGERQYLIGATEHQITLISVLPPDTILSSQQPADTDKAVPPSFTNLLAEHLNGSFDSPAPFSRSRFGEVGR